MTVTADQRYCLQIWVVAEVIIIEAAAKATTEAAAEIAAGTELDLNYNSGNL